jgi:hypothetical protein
MVVRQTLYVASNGLRSGMGGDVSAPDEGLRVGDVVQRLGRGVNRLERGYMG